MELRASTAPGCGPHGPDRPIPIQSQPAAERMGVRRRGAALRRGGAAAGCCGFLRSRKFRIQNSRFKITNRAAACGARRFGNELRPADLFEVPNIIKRQQLRPANICPTNFQSRPVRRGCAPNCEPGTARACSRPIPFPARSASHPVTTASIRTSCGSAGSVAVSWWA